MNKYDTCVFIGRFAPLHNGHCLVIDEGLKRAEKLIVIVGSANESRSVRNPFSAGERAQMIREAYNNNPNLLVFEVEDSTYNPNEWVERIYSLVDSQAKGNIALIGHKKDSSSYYLDIFPKWDSIEVSSMESLSATDIRNEIFGDRKVFDIAENMSGDFLDNYIQVSFDKASEFLNNTKNLPTAVIEFLQKFITTNEYKEIVKEYAFVTRYKKSWENAPYSPIFVTTDALVVKSNHILLVKRNGYPGKGLWALPGGFVEANETIESSCLRELKEETGIKLPEAVLKGHIVSNKVFDCPYRSSRGRTITHAYLIDLGFGQLPKIKSKSEANNDETQKVQWVKLSDIKRQDFFEDHYSIIKNLTKLI